jgi:hypothetical protein
MEISGEIVFPLDASFHDATLHIRVEDIRRADAPAIPICDLKISGVSRQPGSSTPLPFRLNCDVPGNLSQYSLRVHVSLGSSKEVSAGDYVSMQGYPLSCFEKGERVSLAVRRV